MLDRDTHLALYRGLGLAAIPLRPRSKRPIRRGWQEPDAQDWEGAPPDANVGILCGAASGELVVLDFDEPDLCRQVLGMAPRALAAITMVVRTSRGCHVYGRHANASTRVPREGFSILATGSLAVAPPSVHPSGATYRLVEEPRRIAALDEFADVALVGARSEPRSREADLTSLVRSGDTLAVGVAASIIEFQHERVRAAWGLLQIPLPAGAPEGSGADAWSRADFLVALCLIQHGQDPFAVAQLLAGLPGSKATVRGMRYAVRTCRRAAETARTGQLPGRAAKRDT